MWEERPSFEVAPLRSRLALDHGTWTELIVRRLHRPALVGLIVDGLGGTDRGAGHPRAAVRRGPASGGERSRLKRKP